MKVVCEYPVGTLRTALAVNNITMVAMTLRQLPGVGQPFLAFANLSGNVGMADFSVHTDWAGHGNVVTNDVAKNAEMIQAMLDAPPLDAIVMAA